jgi:hypothetical protein
MPDLAPRQCPRTESHRASLRNRSGRSRSSGGAKGREGGWSEPTRSVVSCRCGLAYAVSESPPPAANASRGRQRLHPPTSRLPRQALLTPCWYATRTNVGASGQGPRTTVEREEWSVEGDGQGQLPFPSCPSRSSCREGRCRSRPLPVRRAVLAEPRRHVAPRGAQLCLVVLVVPGALRHHTPELPGVVHVHRVAQLVDEYVLH